MTAPRAAELTTQLRAALIELSVDRMLPDDYDGATENAIGHVERALEIASAPEPESGPGFARFTASDTPADVERKMAAAFAPLRAMRWALSPNYRRRDASGRFVARTETQP
jgi:hypothetical protein